jgi:hypothetical protein
MTRHVLDVFEARFGRTATTFLVGAIGDALFIGSIWIIATTVALLWLGLRHIL